MRRSLVLLFIGALCVFAFNHPVHAATIFTVEITADLSDKNPGDGKCETLKLKCTLRAAIQETNAWCSNHIDGCKIIVPAGTYKLTRVGTDNDASRGDLDITSYLTITGAGAENTFIDGNSSVTNDRVFHILSNYPPMQAVTLQGVTIQNGKSAIGGGIYNQGGHLTLKDSQVLASMSTDKGGGGIMNDGLSVELTGSTIAYNSAQGTFGFGGGIYSSSGDLFLTNSTILSNTANGGYNNGGGIHVGGGRAVLSSSVIQNNTSNQYGGGIRISDGELYVSKSSIKDNYAVSAGGGLYVSSNTKFSLTDSTVSGNMADINVGDGGGGLYVETDADIENTQLLNNSATKGGGAFISGHINISGTTFDDNYGSVSGGAIYQFGGKLLVNASTISRNHANNAGGGIFEAIGSLNLTNSTVSSNDAKQQGGGIFVESIINSASASFYNATIANNTAGISGKGGKGGGILNLQGAVGMQNTILADNTAYETPMGIPSDCAGLFNSYGYNLVESLTGCNINTNTGDLFGTDPQLAPLQGSPTETHKIPLGSPAIDKGNPNGCADANGALLERDQRGHTRPLDGDGDGQKQCDIGAYENDDAISPQP